eukprot:363045-Chlamydomonas_euryale.AAC.6
MQWLRQVAAERRQVGIKMSEGCGRPPDLEEGHTCIKALNSHAAQEITRWRPPFSSFRLTLNIKI